MTKNTWVKHAVRGYSMRLGQVQKRMAESCSFVWVVYGETFRDATYAEATQMRKEQAKLEEGLCYTIEGTDRAGKPILIPKPYFAELPDCEFVLGDGAKVNEELRLAAQANRFAAQTATQ